MEIREKEIKNSIFIASYMINQLKVDGKFVVYEKNEEMMYAYNGQHYEPFEKVDLEKMIRDMFVDSKHEEIWSPTRSKNIQEAIRLDNSCPRVKFDDYSDYMCVNNGILDLKTMELLPHSKDIYFSYKVDVDYDPQAPEPVRFNKFIEKCFTNRDGSIDRDTIEAVLKIGGFILYPTNPIEKMFLFLGEGSNGKSVLLDIFKMFFADKFISYLSLEAMCSEGFQREKLIGSRLNVSSESKSHELNAEELKKIVSGEGITINPKFGKPINYHPRCKVLVASNSKPYFNDTSNGMMRRLYIVNFKNKFAPKHEIVDAEASARRGVFVADDKEELEAALRAERSGIFNLFLNALLALKADNFALEETKNTKDIKEEYSAASDTFRYWITDNYVVDADFNPEIKTATDLLAEYREWYYKNVSTGGLKLSSISVGMKVKTIFDVDVIRKSSNNEKLRGYPLKRKEVEKDAFEECLHEEPSERTAKYQSRADLG